MKEREYEAVRVMLSAVGSLPPAVYRLEVDSQGYTRRIYDKAATDEGCKRFLAKLLGCDAFSS